MYIFPFGMCVLVQVLGSVYEVMLCIRVAGWIYQSGWPAHSLDCPSYFPTPSS